MKIDALATTSDSFAWLQQYDTFQLMGLEGKVSKRALSRTRSLDYLRTQKNNTLLLRHLMQQFGVASQKESVFLMLSRTNMERMLSFLEKEQLLFGLSFFSKGVLLAFMSKLSKIAVLKLFLMRLPMNKFLSLFPTPVLMQLFRHPKIQMPQLQNAMMQLPEAKLQLLFRALTGKDADFMHKKELVKALSGFKKEQLLDAFKKLDRKSVVTMLSFLAKQQPDILCAIPQASLMTVLATSTKGGLIMLMSGLQNDVLRIFNMCLSDKQLAMTLSFMPSDIFTNTMISAFPDTVIDFIAFNSAQGAA